jgi:DNA-binding response OmpR family regulator
MTMKKVLVLEKNKDILELIAIILSDAGYQVDLISSEQEMFAHIKDFQPDLILLDVIQPTPEGTALCQSIKAAADTNHIPVIVLSTHPKAEVMKEICADEVVPKPFDISFLVSVIEEYSLSA